MTEPFRIVAETTFRSLGHRDQPRLVFPGKIEFLARGEWRAMAEQVAEALVERLTIAGQRSAAKQAGSAR